MKRFLTLLCATMLLLSLTAFGFACVPTTTGCYAGFMQIWVNGGLCNTGDCAFDCDYDFVNNGGTFIAWCECGGTQDGVDDNENCHALVTYKVGVPFSTFLSFTCVGSCYPHDTCYQMAPSNGSGLSAGDKLCGCT